MRLTTRFDLPQEESTPQTIFSCLLSSRGYTTPTSQAEFLNPSSLTLPMLASSFGLEQSALDLAVATINHSLENSEDICIFGDYDADGVTATAIMYLALSSLATSLGSHSRILPFIPDRHRHGYGLSSAAMQDIISHRAWEPTRYPDFSPQLYITVDTGIVAHEAIATLRNTSAKVILTDHHLPEIKDDQTPHFPPATHVIHTTQTSGAGIAWILSSVLLGTTQPHLDLATIGVVADMIPLTNSNRSLVKAGLQALTSTPNPGVKALRQQLGSAEKPATTYEISFGLAPRLNAAGRIYSPLDALRLLVSTNQTQLQSLAATIEGHNSDRQNYTDSALTHALANLELNPILLSIGSYHEGVIGLVASKLLERHHRPAVVISQGDSVSKGSARSLSSINITELLRSLPIAYLGLGGHTQAAGFSLATADLPVFETALKQAATTLDPSLLVKTEVVDTELKLSDCTLELATMLTSLEPYGIGNPKPKFALHNLHVLEDRPLKDGKHHKLMVSQDGIILPLMIFNTTHAHPLKYLKSAIVTLEQNIYKGRTTLQLISSYVET